MQRIAALFLLALVQLALFPGNAAAQVSAQRMDAMSTSAASAVQSRTLLRERWVEEWDPESQRWVRVAGTGEIVTSRHTSRQDSAIVTRQAASGRFVTQTRQFPAVSINAVSSNSSPRDRARSQAIARFGPFLVLDDRRAALVGSTDANSPALFDAMLRTYPGIGVIEMVDAAGTVHDIANLAVGRRIRAAGIATHVPDGGSVRSGAVELFLAGTERRIEPGARFAVHSWLDDHGREAGDLSPDAPAHRMYIDYYVAMGMSESRARQFYALTNSVPHSSALWLRAEQMRRWIAPERPARIAARSITARAAMQSFAFEPALAGLPQLPVEDLPLLALAAVPDISPQRDLARARPVLEYADILALAPAWTRRYRGDS